MATVLFLHGSATGPNGRQVAFLERHGHAVIGRPHLPYPRYRRSSWHWLIPAFDRHWFGKAVQIAQAAFGACQPEVVVGASMGGAVAMNLVTGSTPLVLVAPAWRAWHLLTFGSARRVKAATIVLHGNQDRTVFPRYSRRLLANSRPASDEVATAEALEHRLEAWATRADPSQYVVQGRLMLIRGENHRCQKESTLQALRAAVEIQGM